MMKAIFALFNAANEGALKTLAKLQKLAAEDKTEGTKHLSLLVPVFFTSDKGKEYFGFYRPDNSTDKKHTLAGIRAEWNLGDDWTIEYGTSKDWKAILSWQAKKTKKPEAKKKAVNLLSTGKKVAAKKKAKIAKKK